MRILVDRFWPRGMRRDAARIDRWEKDLAPSLMLCKWFSHDPARWPEFRRRFREELAEHAEAIRRLAQESRENVVTLVYSARDEAHNQALVLRQVLEEAAAPPP